MRIVELRAHHLLCILGFKGLGYSKDFIKNMEKVISDINSGSYSIKIITGCDVICSVCPFRKNNKCYKEKDSERRVKKRDLEVMKRLKVKIGDEFPPKKLWALVAKRIVPSDIPIICKGCEWLSLGYCIEGLLKLREIFRNRRKSYV